MVALRRLQLVCLALLAVFAVCQDEGVPDLTDGLRKDREGLLALKSRCSSYGNSKMAAWRAAGNPCLPTPWPHLTCSSSQDSPRVIELDLSNRGIVGEVPVGLRKASRLEVLNLESNKFTGSLPNGEWGKGNMFTRLRKLLLANNDFSGPLPYWNMRGAWRALEELDFANNQFYGGLPVNWLGKYRPLRSVKRLDLSNNLLGRDASGQLLSVWCASETSVGLKPGSGWCPDGTPIEDTAGSLAYLDLSGNDFTGGVPAKWPKIFTRLQYLKLQFNNLYFMSELQYKIPTALPSNWTSGSERGFPSLSILTLYPGNDYLCSLPGDDGNFQDVNLASTYQIADANGEVYGADNTWLCPVVYTDDNPASSPTLSSDKTKATWTYQFTKPAWIWGFRLTIWVRDKDSGEWDPVDNGSGVLLRVYTLGLDGGVKASGLAGPDGSGGYELTLASVKDEDGNLTPIDLSQYTSADYDKFKVEVAVMNIDGVESSAVETPSPWVSI